MFATATADQRLDAHWQRQDDILNMPGINLDFIGSIELFQKRCCPCASACRGLRAIGAVIITPLHRCGCPGGNITRVRSRTMCTKLTSVTLIVCVMRGQFEGRGLTSVQWAEQAVVRLQAASQTIRVGLFTARCLDHPYCGPLTPISILFADNLLE